MGHPNIQKSSPGIPATPPNTPLPSTLGTGGVQVFEAKVHGYVSDVILRTQNTQNQQAAILMVSGIPKRYAPDQL
jgi:hypothetical protein